VLVSEIIIFFTETSKDHRQSLIHRSHFPALFGSSEEPFPSWSDGFLAIISIDFSWDGSLADLDSTEESESAENPAKQDQKQNQSTTGQRIW
jgi:hypothetical protein